MRALSLRLVVLPFLVATPAQAQKPTMTGFCYTDVSGATVYFSNAYESGLNANVTRGYDGQASSREFLAYVRARYNYTSSSNYPSTCSYGTRASAEATRSRLMGTVQKENRKAVEVDWNAAIDSAAVAESFGAGVPTGGSHPGQHRESTTAPKMDHGYCVSQGNPGPQYLSAVFEPPQPIALYQWVQGFTRYLADKNQYKGAVYCTNESLEVGKRIIKAYTDGATAAGRKVVDTDWKFGGAAPAGAPATKPADDDPEPVKAAKPGSPAPAASAEKDGAAARAYCLKDKLMARLFNCAKVQEAVVAYRAAHPQLAGESMEVVFSGDRVNCQTCLMNDQLSAWARRQALNANLKPKVANCVASRFVTGLTAQPYFERVKEQYDKALASCPRPG